MFVDLHCDTIQKIADDGKDFTSREEIHLHLPGIISSNVSMQLFACFVLKERYPGREFAVCNSYIDNIEKLITDNKERLYPVCSAEDLASVTGLEGRTGIMITIEGAAPLMGEVNSINHFSSPLIEKSLLKSSNYVNSC